MHKNLKGYKTDLNRSKLHIEPIFGKKTVGQIKPIDIEELKADLRDNEGKAVGTIWNIFELFRRIINYGSSLGCCPLLNFKLEMPRKNNDVVEYLTPMQAERYLTVLETWEDREVAHMCLAAFFTGMRRGEIFGLEEKDVDFDLRVIYLNDPKGEVPIRIGLADIVADIIKKQIAIKRTRYPGSSYIFPGKSGKKRVDCSGAKRICEAAGLPSTFRPFQGLRHNFAVQLANSGKADMAHVSQALTHKSISFTKKKYGQFMMGTLAIISDVAADVLQGKNTSSIANRLATMNVIPEESS